MKTSLEQLFATLKSLSYPEQMKVSQAYSDMIDPYDAYPDASDMGLFNPVANPKQDIIGDLTREALNFGDDDEFENILKTALLNRNRYGN